MKVLWFLTKRIESLFKERILLANVNELNKYLSKADDVLSKYERNINWTNYNHSYIYQLPFDECLIDMTSSFDKSLNNLFIASSFVLPLDKDEYLTQFKEYKQKIEVFKSLQEVVINFQNESLKLDKLNEDFQNKEVKNIEILGIFASVIAFATSAFNITTASSEKLSTQQVIVSFIAIGTILVLFLALLFVVTRLSLSRINAWVFHRGKISVPRFLVLILSSIMFGLAVFYTYEIIELCVGQLKK